jgi:tape measure domain-containing protein
MAGVEVGTAYITVVPSARGFAGKLHSEIGGSLASQGRAAGESYSGGFSSGIGKIGAIISGAFAVSKLGDVAKFGLEVAAQNEQAQISFTTLLKSGSKAKTFIGDLQQFAAKTPFDFPGLQQSASQLLAAGINSKKIIPIMTTLGNVTSGMGTGAEGVQRASAAIQQMNAAQKISAEDLNQLRDAGIPVYDLLSKALDKPKAKIAQLVQGGKLGKSALDKMMKALETGKGLERFSGLMDKQSQSLTGLWSTVKDTFGQGLAKAISPMIPFIKAGLGEISTVMGSALGGIYKITTAATNLATKAGPKIKQFFDDAKLAAKLFISGVTGDTSDLPAFFSGAWLNDFLRIGKSVGGIFDNLKSKFSGIDFGTVLQAFSPLATIFKGVLPALQQTLPLFEQLGKTLLGSLAQVLPIVAQGWLTIGKALGGALAQALPIVIPAIAKVAALLGGTLAKVLPSVAKLFGKLAGILGGILAQVLPVVAKAFSQLASVVLPILARLLPVLVKGIGQIALTLFPALGKILAAILPILTPIIRILGQLVNAVLPIVITLLKILVPVINVLVKVLAGIITVIAKVITWFVKFASSTDSAHKAVSKAWKAIQGAFSGALRWISGTWKKGWSAVSGFVSGAVSKGRDVAKSALQGVQDRFDSLRSWTGSKFKQAWANAKRWLSDPVGSAKDLINTRKGQIQDVFNTLDSWGKKIFGPRWAGIKDKFTAPIKAVVGYFKNIFARGGTLRKILSDFITGSQIIFGKIKTVMVAPIKGLIGVINSGLIKGAINWLLGKLGVPKNKQVPWIPVPKFAGGGVLPGFTPGRDVHKFYSPTAGGLELSGGEAIMRPEWARAVGGKGAVDRMNDAARRGRMAGGGIYWPTNTHRLSPSYPGHSGVDIAAGMGAPIFATEPGRIAYTGWNHGYGQAIFERFASGLEAVYGHTSRLLTRAGAMVQAGQRIGLVGATGHATGPHLHFEINSPGPFGNSADRAQSLRYLNGANLTGKGGGGILSSVLGFLHGLDPLQWLANKASGLAGNLGGGMWGAGLAHIPAMLVSKGRGFLSRLFGGGSSGGAGRSAGEAVLRQALAMNGVPATGSNIAAWWRQVLTESGDNPRAMQRISDINSASGNRARGWLQVIPSTFAAYHLPGMNNIFGKLDNAAAAINYWKHRYHGDMGVIGHGHGYANGIRSAAPGWAWTGEHGPELVRFGGGETVLNHQDSLAASGQHVEFNDCQFGADPRQVAVELRRESRRRMAAVNLTTAA